ncbi:M-phase inducer phosphatase 3 isoform X4 [Calonectris borealis]|uniref:M-phase inducer phosphatase 3 isoform X4 n=1 Tax=Calonectris borealis TaxID=1323832 RepID=UPI003F4B797D
MTAPPSSRVSQKQHVRSFLTQVLCSTPSFQDAVQQDSREIDSLQKVLGVLLAFIHLPLPSHSPEAISWGSVFQHGCLGLWTPPHRGHRYQRGSL